MKKNLGVLVFILLFIAVVGLPHFLPVQQFAEQVRGFANEQGPWGVAIFAGVYFAASICLFPCSLLTFTAGLAYGFWGLPVVLVPALCAAALSFFLARRLLRKSVDRWMWSRPQSRALRTVIARSGWKFLLLYRISPFIPFNLNSYFLGTLPISFGTYIWVSFVGAWPGTFLFLYLGALGRELNQGGPWQIGIFIVGSVATFALVRYTLQRIRMTLETDESNEENIRRPDDCGRC